MRGARVGGGRLAGSAQILASSYHGLSFYKVWRAAMTLLLLCNLLPGHFKLYALLLKHLISS